VAAGTTSSLIACLGVAGVNAHKGLIEFLHHLVERSRQRRPPADQHIVVAGAQMRSPGGGRKPDDFAQPAADAVSLYRVANLPRHGKADPDGLISRALPCLKHKSAAGSAHAAGRGAKIAAAFQPLDDGKLAILLTH
jgi:hypothetical protein